MGSASFRVSDRVNRTRLRARDLTIGYRSGASAPGMAPVQIIAEELDLEVREGELICLLGPNGAGKSTLLRTLAGLQRPMAGRTEIDGKALGDWSPRSLARRLAVVLTDHALPGLMTGEDLVRLGRHPHTSWTGALSEDDRDVMYRALTVVDALHLARRPLVEMSDGERQKVTIARALAQEPEVLLLDEVTAYLDLPRRVEIVRLLQRIAHGDGESQMGKAVVLATHDLELALRCADRLWLLAPSKMGRPGQLIQGMPETLVLDGSFQQVFASEGVEFDPASGSFEFSRRRRGRAWVEGEGLAATWTRRGLQRLGFQLDPASDLKLEIDDTASGPSWQLLLPGPDAAPKTYAGLEEVLAALTDWTSG